MKTQKIYTFWLIALLCSFGYGLPVLTISSMDRLNPRLFDVVFAIGLLLYNTKLMVKDTNPVLRVWRTTIIWMFFCVLFSFLISSPSVAAFSLFFWIKYLEGYLVVKMLRICSPFISIRLLELVFIGIGLFVSLYSIPQYLGVEPVEVELSEGKTFIISSGIMVGPYSSTYFALAQIIPICLLFCANRVRRVSRFRILFIAAGALFFFVGTNCGSRTAFMLTVLSLVVYLFVVSPRKFILFGLPMALIGLFLFLVSSNFKQSVTKMVIGNKTIEREESLSDSDSDSATARIGSFKRFRISAYDYGLAMPFIGSGFYISPIKGSYRIGYGFHNNYIFAFEQMGIMGLFLFLFLLFRVLQGSYKKRYDNDVGAIMFSFTLVLCFANLTGQIFWHGFGTCDMNTLIIYLMTLSVDNHFLS